MKTNFEKIIDFLTSITNFLMAGAEVLRQANEYRNNNMMINDPNCNCNTCCCEEEQWIPENESTENNDDNSSVN